MSLQSTFIGVLAVAIVLLFCVSAALLREIMVLRERTARLMSLVEEAAAAGIVDDSDVRVEVKSATAWLLAVDSSCGLCHEVVEALAALPSPSTTLLSYEDPEIWARAWPGEILTDRDIWARLAPFTPPALFKIGATGRVEATRLPLNGADAVRVVSETTEARSGANQYA